MRLRTRLTATSSAMITIGLSSQKNSCAVSYTRPAERHERDAVDAGRGAGDRELAHDDAGDDAQAKGRQGEKVTAQPQQGQPDEEGDQHCREHGDDRAQGARDLGLGQQHRVGVGPDREERGLAEADLPGQAHEQRQSDRRDGVDQRVDTGVDHLLRGDQGEDRQDHSEDDERHGPPEDGHTRTPEELPAASPEGRYSRTRMSTTNATASR